MCIVEKTQIAREILAYLSRYPDAQDTMSGISEWWLLEQQVRRRTAEVNEAIADLVEKGLIIGRRGRDAQVRYRVNPQKAAVISKMLKRKPKRPARKSD